MKSGTTVQGKGLAELIQEAEARGATGAEVDKIEKDWLEQHPLCTFNEGKSGLSVTYYDLTHSIEYQLSRKQFRLRHPLQLTPKPLPGKHIKKPPRASRTQKREISQLIFLEKGCAGTGIVRVKMMSRFHFAEIQASSMPMSSAENTRRLLSLHWRY